MSREWLERVREELYHDKKWRTEIDESRKTNMTREFRNDDIEQLLKQANKVDMLVEYVNIQSEKSAELNEFLQKRSSIGWGKHVVEVAMDLITELENENRLYRERFEFLLRRTKEAMKEYGDRHGERYNFERYDELGFYEVMLEQALEDI